MGIEIYCAEIILNDAKSMGIDSAKDADNLAENLSLDLLLSTESDLIEKNSPIIKFSQYQRFKNKATICDYFQISNPYNEDLAPYFAKVKDNLAKNDLIYYNTKIAKIDEITNPNLFYQKSASNFGKKIKRPVQKEGWDFEEFQKAKKLLKAMLAANALILGYLFYQKYLRN
jgi:hypothetical protein